MYAMHHLGCTHVIVSTACGSLVEEIPPSMLVVVDQFIDRTTKRPSTFYDGEPGHLRGICHIPMADAFDARTRQVLVDVIGELGLPLRKSGTIVTIEGPRFSSRAESHMFRSWGAHLINMTTVPEVVLANELGMCYAAIAMATDYDCWRESEESVGARRVP
jgi:5'-methylthioadenosine phosphorylase